MAWLWHDSQRRRPHEEYMDEKPVKLKNEVYGDLLKPAVKEIGDVLKNTVKVSRFVLAGIDYLAAKQDRFQRFLEKTATGLDIEKIVDAPAQITGPVIEGMAYVDEDSIIGDMFANLLRKAIQSDTQDQAHPAFPRIIQQLSDDEAIILFYLKKHPYRMEQTWDLIEGKIRNLRTTREDFPTSKLHHPQHIDMFMNHLNSLTVAGTWKIQPDDILKDEKGHQTGGVTVYEKRLSDFGILFATACVPDHFEHL
jgi:hypothetical protein